MALLLKNAHVIDPQVGLNETADILVRDGKIVEIGQNLAMEKGVERVALEPGATADLTVIDPDAAWTVDAADFKSKAVNSGFIGVELTGRATDVYVGGYATMEDGAIVE